MPCMWSCIFPFECCCCIHCIIIHISQTCCTSVGSAHPFFGHRGAVLHDLLEVTLLHLHKLVIQNVVLPSRLFYLSCSKLLLGVLERNPNMTNNQIKTKAINNSLKYGVLNARSVNNKTEAVVDFILENKLDVMCVTETWLQVSDSFTAIVLHLMALVF